ncbi:MULTISPECIES: D-alanyl-D-alanine carboxypeptidase/D-alanyl-D-alanine-endopeptidase [Kosmotoga]|uniref:D-alanyl-D-alanine carboxypeptidase/D-alanyl-D-alanine-endopeptidase n=1 Tax=Kosmotoga olearia (strain ATCC BAA-1733 / DSM 21960 / TBF 19.5.1) TaxID=521045 RepID=C5CGJ9_KOSOT|nr:MULTISPECIES: D-alanyl-D-alanine carboxypeptidase [Kosmotoga]ACR79581.1 D-alanyl-D-alanine carboxypeptidase/D-alanyl-D-alanine-endopeptidase [Kosmotoga olearia TBF 19.5.1]MDI3524443.1 hypothetical protein [Kosmotoga sp.]MDK2954256.1 hypothetical protein [Kosmotoga sp.]
MKKVIFLIFILLTTSIFGDTVRELVDNFDGFVGIYVEDIETGEIITQYNATKLFTPASVTKLFTLLAALENLGLEYTYKTKFYLIGEDFGVKGSGDPTIYVSTLHDIIAKIVEDKKIVEINNIILDDRLFDRKEIYGRGWMWDDPNPMIGALTIKGPSYPSISSGIDQYTLTRKFFETLKSTFEELGVSVKGEMVVKYISKKHEPAYIHESKPLREILKSMIEVSDNQVAEQIFRTVGAKVLKKGTINNSIAALIRTVKSVTEYGVNDFTITDGPGLSRYNLVSPKLVVEILKHMYKKYGDTLLDILSYSKNDGTIKGRFDFEVWGKTGTLTGVSGLAGFMKTKSGKMVVFSLFENNFSKSKTDAKGFENSILEIFYEGN